MTPLPLPHHWRSRWLVTEHGRELHRIATIQWEDAQLRTSGYGRAVCGKQTFFRMPGILSRMGKRRCTACCQLLNIPQGNGAPLNTLKGKDRNA